MHSLDDFIIWTNGLSVRPVMVMNDGFNMSLQASEHHYCSPRKNDLDHYHSFEIDYPSEEEPLLKPYETEEDIYAYVPRDVVEQIIEKHGGISFDESIEGFKIREDRYDEALSLARRIIETLKEIEETGEILETEDGFKLSPFHFKYRIVHPLFEIGWAYPDDPPAPLIQKMFADIEEEYTGDYGYEDVGGETLAGIPVLVSSRRTTAYANDLEQAQNNLYGSEGSSYFSEIPAIDSIIVYAEELLYILRRILETMENADWVDSDFRWYFVEEETELIGEEILGRGKIQRWRGYTTVCVGYIGDEEYDFCISDKNFVSGDIHDFIARKGNGYEFFYFGDEIKVRKVI